MIFSCSGLIVEPVRLGGGFTQLKVQLHCKILYDNESQYIICNKLVRCCNVRASTRKSDKLKNPHH